MIGESGWLIQLIEDHAKVVPALFAVFSLIGGVIGWGLRRRRHNQELKKMQEKELDDSVVITAFILRKSPHGNYLRLSRREWFGVMSASTVFTNPHLLDDVREAAECRPGLIRLENEAAQDLMMFMARSRVHGNDPDANIDFIMNRDPLQDHLVCGVVAYPAHTPYQSPLDRPSKDVNLIEIIVLNPLHFPEMQKDSFVENVELGKGIGRIWAKRVHDLAVQFKDEEHLPDGKAALVHVDVETSARASESVQRLKVA